MCRVCSMMNQEPPAIKCKQSKVAWNMHKRCNETTHLVDGPCDRVVPHEFEEHAGPHELHEALRATREAEVRWLYLRGTEARVVDVGELRIRAWAFGVDYAGDANR